MSLAETAFQACSFIRPRSRMSSARATARCPAEAAKPRRRTTTRIRRSRRHERASGVRFHHGLPQVGDQAWFHLHLRSIETGRAVLLGHKEPEPCQFASTAFWRPSQGSRVTSHRSSRAGVGCGDLRKPNRLFGSALAANQSWDARTPPRGLRNISWDLCASRSSRGF